MYPFISTTRFRLLSGLLGLLLIVFGVLPVYASTFTSTNPPVFIEDGPAAEVAGVPTISTLTVSGVDAIIDINVSLNITHTFMGDLVITLTSPEGTNVTLLNRPNDGSGGCAGNDMSNTLDDETSAASRSIQSNCTAPAAYVSGESYLPSNALSTFDGESGNGIWTLTVTDYYVGDTGMLNGWSLDITAASAPATVLSQASESTVPKSEPGTQMSLLTSFIIHNW